MALAVVALVLQCWLLYSARPPNPLTFPGSDKVAHFCMFGGVTGLFVLAGVRRAWVLPANLAHAVVSELIQWRWIPGRSGSPLDFLADAAGIFLALWLASRIRNWRPDQHPNPLRHIPRRR